MKILIINNAEKGIDEVVLPLKTILDGAGIEIKSIEYIFLNNIDPLEYDGVILSASPRGNNIADHHLRFYQWIKSYDKPILGICAGHHIIGKLYGSKMIRDSQSEVGDKAVSIDQEDLIFEGHKNSFDVRQNHNDSITLPSDFQLLAHSEKCGVQVMRHRSKPIYTVQFHAEISNKQLILNYLDIVKTQKS